MAKKRRQRTETAAKHDLVRVCAFIGIVVSAILFVIGAILNWCKLGNVASVLNLIAQLTLLVAVAFPAWDYVKGKRRIWRVVYWVALFVYIFGCVFHVIKCW